MLEYNAQKPKKPQKDNYDNQVIFWRTQEVSRPSTNRIQETREGSQRTGT